MAELFRILVALILLYLQTLSRGPFSMRQPVVIPPATATAVATASPVPANSATTVPTATASPSQTLTPTTPPATATSTAADTIPPTTTATATPTASVTPIAHESDPTGFEVSGVPPAQKLPSAVLIFPLVRTAATVDTRIEIMNLTNSAVSVQCFYVNSETCSETNFYVTLTANQPLAWRAATGSGGNGARIAPPFNGEGELKCVVLPRSLDVASHNALQGRAIISDASGPTIGYSASAFRRLAGGEYGGFVALDGVTYEACPDRLHFQALASQNPTPAPGSVGTPASDSELILVPCTEDLENQVVFGTTVQLSVINELEENLSGTTAVQCFARRRFSTIPALRRSVVGSDTAHVIVRGTDVPVLGLVIDRFTVPGTNVTSVSSNEPYLEGSRAASLTLP